MEDVDHLLHNANLKNEIERFIDESLYVVDTQQMPTQVENEYLESMLAWERAPVLPISQWFEPELELAPHESLSDAELSVALQATIQRLFQQNIVLEYTGHLSDRQLYCLIARDILRSNEKFIRQPGARLYWQCIDPNCDEESWLRYYADPYERAEWQATTGLRLPPREPLPYPRALPPND